tara:strand:- start:103 stop:897 length:795 start_codon:yes stop_codon:yes gene_type:complete
MKLNKPILSDDYRHSASRGVDYIENPSLWLIRNYFGVESTQNYSMAMGTASEWAAYKGLAREYDRNIDYSLRCEEVSRMAENQFKTLCQDLLEEDQGVIPKQMQKVGAIANNFIDILYNLDKELISYNEKKIVEYPNLKHKITYVPDFEYDDLIVDTKATQQFPTDPFKTKLQHIRQVSLYGLLSGKNVALLYATDKKCAIFGIPDDVVKREGEFMIEVFSTIEKNNEFFKDARTFMKHNILNTEGYKWDENTKAIADRYWSKA